MRSWLKNASDSFKKLQKHLSINDIFMRVQAVRSAVSDFTGEVELFASPQNGMSRLGRSNVLIKDKAAPIKVPITTIDNFVAESGIVPDWIIMDIEGFEIEALLGAQETIKNHRPRFVVEMHPDVWNLSTAEVKQIPTDLGLSVTPLSGQKDAFTEYGHALIEPLRA